MSEIKYLKPRNPAKAADYEIPAYAGERDGDPSDSFLWGDQVEVLQTGARRSQVRGRGRRNVVWIDHEHLGDEALLELYFIDVGQGDGILVVSPDRKHMVVDGGNLRSAQDTKKNAADYIDWKFFHDYAKDQISIDVLVCSHCDQDHFGGLMDLLNPAQYRKQRTGRSEFDCTSITVEQVFHAGVSWWETNGASGRKGRTLGPADDGDLLRLITDRASVELATNNGPTPQLAGNWGRFMSFVRDTRKRDGTPTDIHYASDRIGTLPFGDHVQVNVLTPVWRERGGKPVAWDLKKDSYSTNGNSVMLRLDYGQCRILLTADLNTASQAEILEAYEGRLHEFACDVAKSCHHGSDDVDLRFLRAMQPAITVISSGDNETHDHPRPGIVGASGVTGFVTTSADGTKLLTPLIYMTEISRSSKFNHLVEITGEDDGSGFAVNKDELEDTRLYWQKKRNADRYLRASSANMVTGIVYGLVNVRTDGKRIMSATMNEGDGSFNIKLIESRFP